MATINKTLLKLGITELRNQGKIDTALDTAADSYIDNITDENYTVLGYDSIDQANSSDFSFDDGARTATYSGGGSATLQTNSLSYVNCKLKAIIIDSNALVTQYEISTDGTNFFTVDFFESNETLSATTKIKITSGDAVIRNIAIVYEKLET